MTTTATVIKANTFIGTGEAPNLLVIDPTYEPQIVRHGYQDRYEQEAAEVFMWLQSALCNKTLEALAERLTPYKITEKESE